MSNSERLADFKAKWLEKAGTVYVESKAKRLIRMVTALNGAGLKLILASFTEDEFTAFLKYAESAIQAAWPVQKPKAEWAWSGRSIAITDDSKLWDRMLEPSGKAKIGTKNVDTFVYKGQLHGVEMVVCNKAGEPFSAKVRPIVRLLNS
jgi:hypothetical protein